MGDGCVQWEPIFFGAVEAFVAHFGLGFGCGGGGGVLGHVVWGFWGGGIRGVLGGGFGFLATTWVCFNVVEWFWGSGFGEEMIGLSFCRGGLQLTPSCAPNLKCKLLSEFFRPVTNIWVGGGQGSLSSTRSGGGGESLWGGVLRGLRAATGLEIVESLGKGVMFCPK